MIKLKLFQAIIRGLQDYAAPIITDYELFLMLRRAFATKHVKGQPIAIRKNYPSRADYKRVVEHLLEQRALRPDIDFRRTGHEEFRNTVFRVVNVPDSKAEEITALVDPFCYISHLSAMQRYGLTNRAPKALTLTTPAVASWRKLRDAKVTRDYESDEYDDLRGADEFVMPLQRISFPDTVRGRGISRHETKYADQWQRIRNSNARLTTIGDTFVQMLEHPSWCGGMAHSLEVFENHAHTYRDEIISAVERCERPIVKVRAGYILEERLHVDDSRIKQWRRFAQRGSSRVLDPEKPFAPQFSENWMLSINV